MTWGGTKIFFREIVTLETGDMPQFSSSAYVRINILKIKYW
jgi:hypothetical protein